MTSCLSALEGALNGALGEREERGGQSPTALLFGKLRSEDSLSGVYLVDHALCNSLYFMQSPNGGIASCDNVLSKLRTISFNTAPIQANFSESDSAVAKSFAEGYFLPGTEQRNKQRKNQEDNQEKKPEKKSLGSLIGQQVEEFPFSEKERAAATALLDTLVEEVGFYDRLREEASQSQSGQGFMLNAFKRLIPIWIARQDCWKSWRFPTEEDVVSKFPALREGRERSLREAEIAHVDGSEREGLLAEIERTIEAHKRDLYPKELVQFLCTERYLWSMKTVKETGIPAVYREHPSCDLFGSRFWDPQWWYIDEMFSACEFVSEDSGEPVSGIDGDFATVLESMCEAFERNYPQNSDLIPGFRKFTLNARKRYIKSAEESARQGNAEWIADDVLRKMLRTCSVKYLYNNYDHVTWPEIVTAKADMLYNLLIGSMIGVAGCMLSESDGTVSCSMESSFASSCEPLGVGSHPVNIVGVSRCGERALRPIALSFSASSEEIGRQSWPVPVRMFGRSYDPREWDDLEKSLSKVIDQFFSPVWSRSRLGQRIESRIDEYFGTTDRRKSLDEAFREAFERAPYYRNEQGAISKQKREGFFPVSRNSVELMAALGEGLKTCFNEQFSDNAETCNEGYFHWHRPSLLVKTSGYKGEHPDKTVALFVERACDKFLEEYGLKGLKDFPITKTSLLSYLAEGPDSELSRFYAEEVLALKKLTGDWERGDNSEEKDPDLVGGLQTALVTYCESPDALTYRSLYLPDIWSFLASKLSAWARRSTKAVDGVVLKGFIKDALDAFKEYEGLQHYSIDPEDEYISRRHFALYYGSGEERPLMVRSFSAHNEIIVTRADSGAAFLLVNKADGNKVKELMQMARRIGGVTECQWVESNELRVHRGDRITIARRAFIEIQ